MADKQDRKAFFRELGRYSALGFEMSLSVLIGAAIGYGLDRVMETYVGVTTSPWLMILWIGFGFAAGVRSLYRAAAGSEKDREKDDADTRKPGGR